MNYGKTIKKYREDRNMTQQELADHVGVTQAAIGFYEKNKREPDAGNLKKISDALDLPLPLLIWLSVEIGDVKPRLRPAFKDLKTTIDLLIKEMI